MTKEEMAAEYAASKMEEVSNLLQEAFLKGYAQGELKSATYVKIDNVTYLDLGLPSGTLWSNGPLGPENNLLISYKFSYNEACKYPIPTVKQFEELKNYVKVERVAINFDEFENIKVVGISGERFHINEVNKNHQGENCSQHENYFWLRDEVSGHEAPVMRAFYENLCSHKDFVGHRNPIFLVKNKADL